ncbi:MAG: hypothetical protein OK457_09100 [Thaumarchaeota archaeon]|nr:hypothetical protein [Nitrososphaerota archaeon]
MITKEILDSDQQVTIPKTIANRIRKIAPYGQFASLDSYISTILDDFVTQLEGSRPMRARYNPFSEKELKQINKEIQCYSLYA